MSVCDYSIKRDIAPSCDDPIVPGVEQEGVIFNRADIDFATVTFSQTHKNVIETLALKSGAKGYKVIVYGNTPFTGTNTALTTGTYRNTFTNTVNMVILDNNPDVCGEVIDGLANGEFVVILENKSKGLNATTPGYSAFQIYGYYQGLNAAEISNDKYSEETEGGWSVSLSETKVPKSALFLYKTSYEATKTMVESLTATTE